MLKALCATEFTNLKRWDFHDFNNTYRFSTDNCLHFFCLHEKKAIQRLKIIHIFICQIKLE